MLDHVNENFTVDRAEYTHNVVEALLGLTFKGKQKINHI